MNNKLKIKRMKTTDNWYPNFPNDEVEVRLYSKGNTATLSIWGMDDYALSIDDTTEKLRKIYNKMPEPVTVQWAVDNGFKPW